MADQKSIVESIRQMLGPPKKITFVTETKKPICDLTVDQCKKLENLRLKLWDNTFAIERDASKIVTNIDELNKMIDGTEQNPYLISYLKDIRRTATFLESKYRTRKEEIEKVQPESLHDESDKIYVKLGHFNHIIPDIYTKCGCSKKIKTRARKGKKGEFILE